MRRVPSLYCRNERAVLEFDTRHGLPLLLVPVAAVGGAGLRLHAMPDRLGLSYRGPTEIPCCARYGKGAELGWFEQGSTVIVIAPAGVQIDAGVFPGGRIRMGERLMVLPEGDPIRQPADAAPLQTQVQPSGLRVPPETNR